MKRDERNGLILLLAFLVVCGVFLASTTDGGRGISNIFMNIISDVDYAPSPALETQLATLREPLNIYWIIGISIVLGGLVTLVLIIGYLLVRRRIPRSWCLLLIVLGILAMLLTLPTSQVSTQLAAIPKPAPPISSAAYEGLAGEISALQSFVGLDFVLAVIGGLLLGWSLVRQRQRA